MARSKSDISNSAIRIFLQDVGRFYDSARGFEPFVPKKVQKQELLDFFEGKCCYCGVDLGAGDFSQDHLIPMNKTGLGLHAWGNVVPCCRPCNNERQSTEWIAFLGTKASGDAFKSRLDRIRGFVKQKGYDPNLNLHRFADNLYEDVGQVALTLIQLRYKQAEEEIRRLLDR